MKLSKLLNCLLTETPLSVSLREDFDLSLPEGLMHPEVHSVIGDSVAEAAMAQNLSVRGAHAFGEWLAELLTGWSTRFSNEADVLRLDEAFGSAAFGNPKEVVRLYLLPDWEALDEYLAAIRAGVEAAYKSAREM